MVNTNYNAIDNSALGLRSRRAGARGTERQEIAARGHPKGLPDFEGGDGRNGHRMRLWEMGEARGG